MKTPKPKICTKCGIEKSLEEYSQYQRYSFKEKRLIWHKMTQCKACLALYKRIYNQVNRETISEKSKTYRREHKEELAAARKTYKRTKDPLTYEQRKKRTRDIEEIRQRLFLVEYKNKDQVLLEELLFQRKKEARKKQRKYAKEYVQKHKGEIIEKRNIPAHKEEHRQYNKKYIENMPDAYIISVLRRNTILTVNEIPQDLIELKREHLKLSRKLRKAQ